MVRETHGVPYIFGHRATDDRFFPEIVGIGTVVLPLHGSPHEAKLAKSGNAMRRMLVELAVMRSGLPEPWLEELAVKLVEADGTTVLETAFCRVAGEKLGQDGFHHLFLWTYPFALSPVALGKDAKILLSSSSGHAWSEPVVPLLRAA
jgi:hypothetical protein